MALGAAAPWLTQPLRPEPPHSCGPACPAAQRHPRRAVQRAVSICAGTESRPAADRGDAQSLLPGLCRGSAGCRAEPLYVPALPANGFLPDFAGLARGDSGALDSRLCLLALQPEGATATRVIGGRCSNWPSATTSSCWPTNAMPTSGSTVPPQRVPVALRRLGATVRRLSHLLSFHSLSKRSGLPGLRSGMVAGNEKLIQSFRAFRNVAGPQVPTPILAASAACWRDEVHVQAGRAAYQEKMAAADAHPGQSHGSGRPADSSSGWEVE